MVDNFQKYKEYIAVNNDSGFDDDLDTYYVIELLSRGKDNPGLPAANYHFKNYYINKIDDLDKYRDEIIKLCDIFRMRAYCSVGKKSYKQVTLDTMAETARRVANGDFKKSYSVWESCSGKYCINGNKVWVVDIDKEDAEEHNTTTEEVLNFYIDLIHGHCKPFNVLLDIFPTKSGYHLITKPFDVMAFNKGLRDNGYRPHSDDAHSIIKKNHLTLLYCPDM